MFIENTGSLFYHCMCQSDSLEVEIGKYGKTALSKKKMRQNERERI